MTNPRLRKIGWKDFLSKDCLQMDSWWKSMTHCVKVIAVCKDSYVVYACGFDRAGRRQWFTELMRITENHYKYCDLHGSVSFWPWTIEEVRPYFLNVILGDLWISLKLFWGDSWQFSVICEPLRNHFWGNSWWFTNQSEIVLWWFFTILGDSRISLKLFCGYSWWLANHCEIIFGAILSNPRWFVNQSESVSGWFSVICNHSEIIFGVILDDLQISLKLFWGDSWWFLVICKPLWNHFWAILDDSQWFTNQSEIILGQFSVILNDFW